MSGFQFIHYEKYKKDDIAGIIGSIAHPPAIALTSKMCRPDDSEREPRRTPGAAPARRSALQKLSKDGKLKRFETTPISCSPGFFLIRMRQQNEVIQG